MLTRSTPSASGRDTTTLGNSFYQMKSRDTFAPIGPYLVTADEINAGGGAAVVVAKRVR